MKTNKQESGSSNTSDAANGTEQVQRGRFPSGTGATVFSGSGESKLGALVCEPGQRKTAAQRFQLLRLLELVELVQHGAQVVGDAAAELSGFDDGVGERLLSLAAGVLDESEAFRASLDSPKPERERANASESEGGGVVAPAHVLAEEFVAQAASVAAALTEAQREGERLRREVERERAHSVELSKRLANLGVREVFHAAQAVQDFDPDDHARPGKAVA